MHMNRLTNFRTTIRRQNWEQPLFAALRAVVLIAAVLFMQAETTAAAPGQQEEEDLPAPLYRETATHFYKIQILELALEDFLGTGGAIEPLGDILLLATPRGRIAVLKNDGALNYLEKSVPMYASVPEQPVAWHGFRVADILLKEESQGAYTLFASHHFHAGDCVEIRISSIALTLENGEPTLAGEWNTLFSATPCIATALFEHWESEEPKVGGGIQVGGKMLLDGAHHLLIAVGDNAWYEWQEFQTAGQALREPVIDPEIHLGKVVRVELATGTATIVAQGLRNPQGFIRDREGMLWLTEHGPQGGDELNLVRPGLDYGWPHATHGILYGNRVWPYNIVQGDHTGYEQPVYSWIPSIGISSLTVVEGEEFPLWHGDLLIGSLRSSALFRVRVRQQRVVYYERIPLGKRIRDIAQMPDGRIVLLADFSNLLFVRRTPLFCHKEYSSTSIYTYDANEVCIDLFGLLDETEDLATRSLQTPPNSRLLGSGDFDVYIQDGRLIYVRDPCDGEELNRRFFLHVTPLHRKDIAEETRDLGLNIYDFNIGDEGVESAANRGACFVSRDLPSFGIKSIYTGQVDREITAEGEVRWVGPVWETAYTFDHGEFDVSIQNGRLIYVRDPCDGEELNRRFFLHVTPLHRKDIAEETRDLGLNIYDFNIGDEGVESAANRGACFVSRDLPSFGIKSIYTGQVDREITAEGEVRWVGPVWETAYTFDHGEPAAETEGESSSTRQTALPEQPGDHPGAPLFAEHCSRCHNLTERHNIGPHLNGVIGRQAGQVTGFIATDALRDLEISWTPENLAQFIADPAGFAPGADKGSMGLTEEEARLIADFLASQQ